MSEFPSTRYERGKIFAKTGLQVGKDYAAHYLKSLAGSNASKSDLHKKTAEHVFGEFTKLRGTALKIAQSFSVDQGFLPEEFSEVMTQAQYKVPPINRALIRSIIRRELGAYPEQIFREFDTAALAAASIGQVHKAVLKSGEPVAVKIQYPGVRDTISSDLALARTLFRQIVSDSVQMDEYMEEVKSTLLEETNYLTEGRSIERFHTRFHSDSVITPRWLPELSTERVLTMTFIEGVHLYEFLDSSPSQKQINHFGQLLWDFFHDQVREREEIHADTHPGNFLFTPDGKLGVIDFGCVKTFPDDFFIDYLQLLPTHLQRDEDAIKELYYRLDVLKDDPETDSKESRMYEFCKNYGFTFAMPYVEDRFDFGDEEYKKLIRGYTKNAPLTNEPRGNKHFIYTTRVHLGLYHFLMKLGAVVSTVRSKKAVEDVLRNSG
ncbi:MAG: AarF/ABC1/UbiB kinase family protein [Balneolaceae bacterium]|nr:AarF/ABC1/UbiB kinase family protein [Balneolaceae bacterium]